jgi:hypothetical protein
MAGEIGVIMGYSGSVLVNGVPILFGSWSLRMNVSAASYQTFGDGGFDRNTIGRKKATLSFRTPYTGNIPLASGTLYTFTLNVGVTEAGVAVSLGSVDARITSGSMDVQSQADRPVEVEYQADVSGPFGLLL